MSSRQHIKFFNSLKSDGFKSQILLSFIVAVLVTTIVYAGTFLEPSGFSLWQLPGGFLIVFFLWQLQIVVAKRLDKTLPWKTDFRKRLLWQTIICFIISFLILNVIYLIFKLYSIRYYERPGSSYNIYIFFMLNSLIFIFFLLVTGLQLGHTFILQWKESQLFAEKLKNENNQAKIMRYQHQLNPHFVFNNLNILTALIEKDPSAAKIFTEQFSTSYRYLLQETEKELVSLYTELNFIESYIHLLKVRFQQRIQFSFTVAENLKSLFIPPFSLQLLIENCVKHNITSLDKPLLIEVFSNNKTITVRNNLQLKTMPESNSGAGLKNIINRYGFLSDRRIEIEKTNTNFSVTLPLLESHEYNHY